MEQYFVSLQRVQKNLKEIDQFAPLHPKIQDLLKNQSKAIPRLDQLKVLVDSTQSISQLPEKKPSIPQIRPYEVKGGDNLFDITVQKTTDSVKKKGLFSRLGDAVKGKTDVQTETIIITTKQGNLTSAQKLKSDFDSIIQSANRHYTNEVNIYKNRLKVIEKNSNHLFPVFDQLLSSSNQLMDVYTLAVDQYNEDLQKQYDQQNSKSKTYKSNAVFALMLLMILVSITIIYIAIQSIRYEKKLTEANQIIQKNLNFKTRVLGMFSHEMRAPMQIMNLFLNRIAKIAVLDEVQQHIKTIQFTNKSLLIQANQILEYAKNEDKKWELKPSEVHLKENIDTLLTSFGPYIEARNNQFIVKTDIAPEWMISTDFTKIHQLYTNLLGNANKFTENGKITVNTKGYYVEGQPVLEASVSDTGSGISENDLKEIFEPYYQGIVSDQVENIGIGLGLNLCKEIVQLFDGTISAKSEKGKGSEFSFTLKL